jgi:hypothetical protein
MWFTLLLNSVSFSFVTSSLVLVASILVVSTAWFA